MPIITRLAQQKKDHERVNLYLDGKFAFGITLESVLQKSLKSGQELSLEQVENLKSDGDYAKILNKVLNFATIRPHSEREIMLWFRRKKIEDENVIQKVSDKLRYLNLINDLEFAKWWVEQRSAFRPKPIRVLKLELRQKGISTDTIEEALSCTETQNEVETARRVIAKKLDRYNKMPYEEGKKRLSNFLAMRGFSWDTIKEIINELYSRA